MPFAFLIIGSVFVVSGVRNTSADLMTLLHGDFTGQRNFMAWMFAILVIGALGYSENLKPLSRSFLALVIVVLFLSNGGFFSKFNTQFFGNSNSGTSQLAQILV